MVHEIRRTLGWSAFCIPGKRWSLRRLMRSVLPVFILGLFYGSAHVKAQTSTVMPQFSVDVITAYSDSDEGSGSGSEDGSGDESDNGVDKQKIYSNGQKLRIDTDSGISVIFDQASNTGITLMHEQKQYFEADASSAGVAMPVRQYDLVNPCANRKETTCKKM